MSAHADGARVSSQLLVKSALRCRCPCVATLQCKVGFTSWPCRAHTHAHTVQCDGLVWVHSSPVAPTAFSTRCLHRHVHIHASQRWQRQRWQRQRWQRQRQPKRHITPKMFPTQSSVPIPASCSVHPVTPGESDQEPPSLEAPGPVGAHAGMQPWHAAKKSAPHVCRRAGFI